MKMLAFNKNVIVPLTVLAVSCVLGFLGPITALAATTPSLGAATSYGVLGGTYTNTSAATTINGDVGFTTGPAQAPLGTHTNYGSGAPTPTARIDAASALTALAANSCTETLGVIVDLSSVAGHATGIYTPGVYCSTGAMSIGTGGITLSGAGTYIFRAVGALTSVDNSVVTLTGASACDVFWTPTAATTLGATTVFQGTIVDNANAITVGADTTWTGRALSLGAGVVTTGSTDTITVPPTCSTAPSTPSFASVGNINVVKLVINDNGGTKGIADFPLFVNGAPVVSGVTNSFPAPANAYTVTETSDPNYIQTFSGGCDVSGRIGLSPGDNKFCIVTNNDRGASLVVPPLIDLLKTASPLSLPGGSGTVVYTYTLRNVGIVPVTNITIVGDTCSPIVRVSGDTNADNKLDVNETWVHTCSTTLSATHMNTAVATGWANGISAVDIASATVVVGVPVVPPLIHIVKVPSVFALPAPGGAVTYRYTVTNPGTAALSNVSVTDDKCTGLPGRVVGHPGDLNKNDLLESNETWSFTCQTNLTQTTTNVGTAEGSANGLTATDFAIATVVVSAPGLPNTGFPEGTSWDIVVLSLILILALTALAAVLSVLRKRAM